MFELGSRITELRKSSGLSQEKLAEMLGVTRESLNRIEKNRNRPSLETIERICGIFQISVPEFFTSPSSELPADLIELLNIAKELSSEQRNKLIQFIESMKGDE